MITFEKITVINLTRRQMEIIREYIRALNYLNRYHDIDIDVYSTDTNRYSISLDGVVMPEKDMITDFVNMVTEEE